MQHAGGRAAALTVGLAGVAVSAVLWTFVSPNDALAYRGGFLLAALATTAVLFSVVCSQRSVLARSLSVRPLRYVGRISYGLYLWHFPLFIYLDHARTGLTGYSLFAVRALTTLMVATASFYLIERPIRQGSLLRGWRSWAITPAVVVTTAVALVAATNVPALAGPAPQPAAPARGSGPPVKALIVGDSTAETLDIGLSENAGDYGIDSFNGGILGCGFTSGTQVQEKGVDSAMDPVPRRRSSGEHPVAGSLEGRHRQGPPERRHDPGGPLGSLEPHLRGTLDQHRDPSYAAYVQSELIHAVEVAGSGGAAVVVMTAPC